MCDGEYLLSWPRVDSQPDSWVQPAGDQRRTSIATVDSVGRSDRHAVIIRRCNPMTGHAEPWFTATLDQRVPTEPLKRESRIRTAGINEGTENQAAEGVQQGGDHRRCSSQ